jgi:HD-like signal output (HDOD) protein
MIKTAPLEKSHGDQMASAANHACPHCLNEVPAGSKFCNNCGAQLTPQAAGSVASKPPAGAAVSNHVIPIPSRAAASQPGDPAREAAKSEPHAQTGAPHRIATKLRLCIESIESNKDIPAFSHHVMEVMGMMGDDETSLQNLTNIILRDYSLTLALLRLANSAFYNRSGNSICSVARAITMMGINAVKRLTSGMILLENYSKRSPGVKELLLLSLLTASHSYKTAQQLKMRDAEQVYTCAMFRNLGEVLIALFKSESYEIILREIEEHHLTVHEACHKVLDFTYEELGRAIASAWGLPGVVSSAMDSPKPGSFARQSDADRVKTLVAFSHDLTHIMFRRTPENRSQALDNLLDKYSSIPNMDRKSIQTVLDEAVTKTQDTFAVVGIPINDLHLRRQYEVVLTGAEERRKEEQQAALAAVTDNAAAAAALAAAQAPAADEDLLAKLAAEVHAAVEPGNEPRLNEVLMMVLEACHRGAGFTRVVFCLATRDRASVRGRAGLGPGIEAIISFLQIPLFGHSEPLTLPLLSKKDLFINAELDDRYHDSPLVTRLAATCFGLFPIIVDHVAVGCLYFDKLVPNAAPPQKILDTLAGLRDVLAELIRRTRAQA